MSKLRSMIQNMSPKVRNIIIGTVVVTLLSLFIPMSQPHVEVKAETLFYLPLGIPFTNALLVTFIVDIVLIVLAVLTTARMNIVPRGLQNIMEIVIEALYKVFQQVNRDYVPRVFPVVATIFLFVLVSNWLGLIPGVGSLGVCKEAEGGHHGAIQLQIASTGPVDMLGGEQPLAATEEGEHSGPNWCGEGKVLVPLFRSPSADLNFTFALALLAFFYIEYLGYDAFGKEYFRKFVNTREGAMGFVVGLLELISEFARILAFSFRLFGNIFAGEVVLVVMAFLVPLTLPLPFYGFEVFVGFIQAFVFAMLTMAFIAVAVTPHGDGHGHDDHGDGAAHDAHA